MKTPIGFTIFYIILTIIEITADYTESKSLVYVTKPLLVISLIFFYRIRKSPVQSSSKRKLFLMALFFALLGDICLMIKEKDLFIPGLGSFLIMQWLYITFFRSQVKSAVLTRYAVIRLIPFLLYAIGLFFVISPGIPDPIIRAAVGVYAISIAIMGWLAFLRHHSVSSLSYTFVFAGALLFMVSDSLIAVGKFIAPLPFQGIWVMGTYATAQYLITVGVIKSDQTD